MHQNLLRFLAVYLDPSHQRGTAKSAFLFMLRHDKLHVVHFASKLMKMTNVTKPCWETEKAEHVFCTSVGSLHLRRAGRLEKKLVPLFLQLQMKKLKEPDGVWSDWREVGREEAAQMDLYRKSIVNSKFSRLHTHLPFIIFAATQYSLALQRANVA